MGPTGKGKILVATLPPHVNAFTGKNCQLVTVHDYLAMRDATMTRDLYKLLSLSVGCLQNGMDSRVLVRYHFWNGLRV
jgi:preprotein translocase subunit SecA